MANHTETLTAYVNWLETTGRLTREEKEMVIALVDKQIVDELTMSQQGC